MSRQIDQAADLQAIANDAAVLAHANRPKDAARAWCLNCGELIPHERRVLGVARCIECQTKFERVGGGR